MLYHRVGIWGCGTHKVVLQVSTGLLADFELDPVSIGLSRAIGDSVWTGFARHSDGFRPGEIRPS